MSAEDWSAFDDPPALGGGRRRGQRGRGGRAPARQDHRDQAPRAAERERPEPVHPEAGRPRRPSEEPVYFGHPHWRGMLGFYVKGFAISMLVGLVMLAVAYAGFVPMPLAVLSLPLALGVVYWIAWLIRRTTTYTVTTRRVMKKWGIIVKNSDEAPLRRVQNVSVSQGLVERLLGIGTLDFDTAGEREGEELLRLWGVRRPWVVRGLIHLDEDDY